MNQLMYNYKNWILVCLAMSKVEVFIIIWLCFFAFLYLYPCSSFVPWFFVVDFTVCSIYEIFCDYHLCSLLASCYFVTFKVPVCGSGVLFIMFWQRHYLLLSRSCSVYILKINMVYSLTCNINRGCVYGWCVCLW